MPTFNFEGAEVEIRKKIEEQNSKAVDKFPLFNHSFVDRLVFIVLF